MKRQAILASCFFQKKYSIGLMVTSVNKSSIPGSIVAILMNVNGWRLLRNIARTRTKTGSWVRAETGQTALTGIVFKTSLFLLI